MPEIELPPNQWRSDQPRRREPILGSGAGALLAELAITAVGIGLLIVVVLLGIYLKGLLLGEKPAQGLPIQEGVTSNGVHWKLTPDKR